VEDNDRIKDQCECPQHQHVEVSKQEGSFAHSHQLLSQEGVGYTLEGTIIEGIAKGTAAEDKIVTITASFLGTLAAAQILQHLGTIYQVTNNLHKVLYDDLVSEQL
jgi:hypothetical protein